MHHVIRLLVKLSLISFHFYRDSIKALKDGEDMKRKTYTAVCVIPRQCVDENLKAKILNLDNMPAIELSQRTPIRVLHRRPNAIRTRSVYNMKVDVNVQNRTYIAGDNFFVFKLSLCTQAGTYVKEFVHGDFGRTTPNLSSILGCEEVDIIALDVEVR